MNQDYENYIKYLNNEIKKYKMIMAGVTIGAVVGSFLLHIYCN